MSVPGTGAINPARSREAEMRKGAQEILLSLCFGEDPHDINRQVSAHMRRDETPERVLDVLWAFAALNAAAWPGLAKYFRLYLQIFAELWADELEQLPVSERAVVSVQTLRAMGIAPPDTVERVAELARVELEGRGESAQFQ